MQVTKKKTKNVHLKERAPRKSKYENYFFKLAKLKRGESIVVKPDKGQTAHQLQNALIMANRRAPKRPPAGYRYSCCITAAGAVAVSIVKK